MRTSTKPWLIAGSLCAVCLNSGLAADGGPDAIASAARSILAESGVKGGLVVHVGCGDGKLAAALGAGAAYRVHGLGYRGQV